MPDVRYFGRLANGRDVEAITLGSPEGLQAEILTYGAILRSFSFPVAGSRRELVLGFERLDQYESDPAYVGPVVGRFANRIAQGRLRIDNQEHQLSRNERGNHLHGGLRGIGKQLWQLRGTASHTGLELALHSPTGEEGYPGNLDIALRLDVSHDTLLASLSARTDAPTPVNLTWHPYFNLGEPFLSQWLRIPASRYLPVGPGLIPTGQLSPVDGTAFDFREGRVLQPPPLDSHPQIAQGGGYDHCWVIDPGADCHCELRSAARDIALTMKGSGPGLQFYSGQFLARSHPGIGNGIALEPQGLPDAPNHPGFPDAILRPGDTYSATIEYRVALLTPPG